jgi:hypothetical protein
MSEKIIKRIGDPEKRKRANKSLAEVGNFKSEYRACKAKTEELVVILGNERASQSQANAALIEMQTKLSDAQEEIDADFLPEGAQPIPRIQKRDKFRILVSQLESSLDVQKRNTQIALENVNLAERKLFNADKDLNRCVDNIENAELLLSEQSELDKERAEKLAKLEIKRAKVWEKEQIAAIDSKSCQLKDLKTKAVEQAAVASKANVKAIKRQVESNKKNSNTTKQVKESRDKFLLNRIDAVLELKTNTGFAKDEVAVQADKHVKKVQRAKQKLDDEKDAYLAKGLNPYVEFRSRELNHEAKIREKKIKDTVELNKIELSEKLSKEEEERRRSEVKELHAKEYENKHRDEQGRHVIETRNNNYITSITSGSKELLDPSGRASRVDPSQITEIVDYSFGLGKSSRIPVESVKRITEQIRENLNVDRNDLGEYQRLINGLLPAEEKEAAKNSSSDKLNGSGLMSRSQTAPGTSKGIPDGVDPTEYKAMIEEQRALERKAAELNSLANLTGRIPGAKGAAATVNLPQKDQIDLMKIVEEEGVVGVESGPNFDETDLAKYPVAQLSKFEKDSFVRAKERQRERLEKGQIQIAGGREFKGQSFIPKPAEVMFKDFEVGKTYKRIFTLTNASYTFNSFKILDLDNEYIDFFLVTFEKPGRMSAGVSCPLEVEFTPQVNKDIFTTLKFFTETGPIEVPLVCLIKRCAPRVLTTEIDFGSVVIGEKQFVPVHITNSQAISTDFRIISLDGGEDLKLHVGNDTVIQDSTNADLRLVNNINATESTENEDLDIAIASHDDDDEISSEIGTEPALNEAELSARVRRVLNNVLRTKTRENPVPFSFRTVESSIDGYSSTSVEVICAPLKIGSLEAVFSIIFNKVRNSAKSIDENGDFITKEQLVTVKVVADKVPIYIADEVVDMRTTLFGRIYRKAFELRNRSRTPYRVNIKIKPPFNNFIEVSPQMAFVQGGGSQLINVKFTPTEELVTKCAYFSVPFEDFKDAALVNIPIEISVVDQEIPAFFILTSKVTHSKIELSSLSLDFGKVYVNQQSTLPITLKNTSLLPVKIGFVRLKREVSVEPSDGFATLLPNETMEFEISFCPSSSLDYNFDIILKTSFNDTYAIKTTGIGVDSPIVFSNSTIHMRTTCAGERVLESIMVTNKSQKQQIFEIMAPDQRFTWLRIAPTALDLLPGASSRVEFEFLPPTDSDKLNPSEWHENLLNEIQKEQEELEKSTSIAIHDKIVSPFEEWTHESGWLNGSGAFGGIQWVKDNEIRPKSPSNDSEIVPEVVDSDCDPPNVPESEWGIIGSWRLPIFIKPTSKAQITNSPPIFVSIQTAVTLPQLVADMKLLDFGQMSIGVRTLSSFKIRNLSHEPVSLLSSGLNAIGPFQMLNCPKTIEPNEGRTIMIECLPSRPGLNVEILELASGSEIGGHRIRVTLRAQGVQPSIELLGISEPPKTWNLRSGILDFGNVVGTDTFLQKFTILNKSSFSIDANIIRAVSAGTLPFRQQELIERTSDGLPIFSYRPERCNIKQGESQEIEVIFRPDRGRFKPFREDLDIIVGDTDEVLRVGLFGRSWTRQMFVVPSNPLDEAFAQADPSSGLSQVEDLIISNRNLEVRKLAHELNSTINVSLPPLPPIKLEFPDPYAEGFDPELYVTIGGEGAPPAKGKGTAPTSSVNGRQQKRTLLISCAKTYEIVGNVNGGTFEIILDKKTKDSGMFIVSTDKGNVTAGGNISVDILCTLPVPKGIGGLSVGSWQDFNCNILVKGGWLPEGDVDEKLLPILIKAFVSL